MLVATRRCVEAGSIAVDGLGEVKTVLPRSARRYVVGGFKVGGEVMADGPVMK